MNKLSHIRKVDKEDAGDGRVRLLASVEVEDRYGTVIELDGLNLEQYLENPVIFLNHAQDSLPIARAVEVQRTDKGLEVEVEFDMEDPEAVKVYDKVQRGFLNGVSIGFIPLEKEDKGGTVHYTRSTLLEISLVGIPANPEAVVIRRGMISDDLMLQLIQEVRRFEQAEAREEDVEEEQDIHKALEALEQKLQQVGEAVETIKELILDEEEEEQEEDLEPADEAGDEGEQEDEERGFTLKNLGFI